MTQPSRRRALALAGGTVLTALAGCTEAVSEYLGSEEEGEFLVVSTSLNHSPGYRIEKAEYPDDIVARVSIENRRPTRQQGRLELELRYVPESRTWHMTDDIDVTGGVSPTYTYVFESAYQPESEVPDDYEISAEIVQKSRSE